MEEKDLKDLYGKVIYCDKHVEWVIGWHKHADHEDDNEIENFLAKTHYWITVVKCCKPLDSDKE